jgi:hypothetical protein
MKLSEIIQDVVDATKGDPFFEAHLSIYEFFSRMPTDFSRGMNWVTISRNY